MVNHISECLRGIVNLIIIGTLPTLGAQRLGIGDLLLRMAQSSKAVLWSILALVLYFRGGDTSHADTLKHAALRELIDATSPAMDVNAGIEHVAAGLVLCLVEVTS